MNIYSFLTDAAATWPEQPAVRSSHSILSFRELLGRAERLKAQLFQAGVRPGMGIALVAKNSAEFVIGLFAGLGCGAVVMPISHNVKGQELNRIMEVVPVTAVLHDGSFECSVKTQSRQHCDSMEIVVRPAECHVRVAYGVANPAVIRFTSGTTGLSKGVVLSHRTVYERSEAAVRGLGLVAGDTVTWVLPMAYHFVVSILTYVRYGVTLALPSSLASRDILETARDTNSKLLYASPTIIDALASDRSDVQLLPDTTIISTSSGLAPVKASNFYNRFQRHPQQLYGLIEVGLPLGQSRSDASTPHSVGRVMPGYEAAILDDTGNRLPPTHPGKLAVRGPGLFDAYLAPYRPAADVLTNGWFLTGDIAREEYDGSFTVCGRESSAIHANGEWVFPEEIEAVICSFPGIRLCRVFGIGETTQHGDPQIVAELLPHPSVTIDLESLRGYLRERLSAHKIPHVLRTVSELRMTDSGKVVRAT